MKKLLAVLFVVVCAMTLTSCYKCPGNSGYSSQCGPQTPPPQK